jgi:hypothetical protein
MNNLIKLQVESQYEMEQVLKLVEFLLEKGFEIVENGTLVLGINGDFKVQVEYDVRDALLSINIAPSLNARCYVSTYFSTRTVMQFLVPNFEVTDDEGAMIVSYYDLIYAFLDKRLGTKSGSETFQKWMYQRYR